MVRSRRTRSISRAKISLRASSSEPAASIHAAASLFCDVSFNASRNSGWSSTMTICKAPLSAIAAALQGLRQKKVEKELTRTSAARTIPRCCPAAGRERGEPSAGSTGAVGYRSRSWNRLLLGGEAERIGFPCLLRQRRDQCLDTIGLGRWLVPADAIDPGKAHGDAGSMPRRALQALECDFEHEPGMRLMPDLANGTETVDGVVAHEAVELFQLLVGEAEIGFADRHQLLPLLAVP